ncbi:uncharacterized protein LOC132182221 [Corylus avellana]|uniref:uncharacterized protein LOC132182221 n=1 Tax=Corylus avellana TaxID=13451 RepID=UPI00286B71FB|nr:uncharacterized protein LOC132182221 [Corylus avellana]
MIPRDSLSHVATLGSCTKKTNLCFSTPLLLGRKMLSINRTSSSLLASLSKGAHIFESHPLMMIEPADEKDKDGRRLCRFYDYVNEKVVNTNTKIPKELDHAICVGSSHGWLAYVSRLDCSVFLWSPFTTSPLILLPPIHTLHREELDEEKAYECDDDFGFKVKREYLGQSRRYAKRLRHIIRKIIFSSIPTSDDCIVVALSNLNTCRNIVFCKPGDKSWTFIDLPFKKYFHIVDIIHFKDQLFYAVSNCGLILYTYDLADLSSPKSYHVKNSFRYEPLSLLEGYPTRRCKERYYLVESLGGLLWVRRHFTEDWNGTCFDTLPDKTIMFEVYRLDFSRNTWECTKCIGEQVLFLGSNQSLSLSARDFPSLKENCIYFTDDSCKTYQLYPPYGFPDFGHYELGGVTFGEFEFAHHPEGFWVMRNFH